MYSYPHKHLIQIETVESTYDSILHIRLSTFNEHANPTAIGMNHVNSTQYKF